MSSSIYNIPNWAATTSYNKNDIVKNSNLYYYALSNFTSASLFATDLGLNLWGGIISDNSETKPHFFWKSSYSHTTENNPKIKKISFGDQYVQRSADGISNILPVISLDFESDLQECSAILHFLTARGGWESFVYLPPAPYNILSRWTCEKFNSTQVFYNNYKITVQFERSVV